MMRLRVSVTFLDPAFHGSGDQGRPEWPPSPLRMFHALIAAAARRYAPSVPDRIVESLQWLEAQAPPVIVAPGVRKGLARGVAVPNN